MYLDFFRFNFNPNFLCSSVKIDKDNMNNNYNKLNYPWLTAPKDFCN
jgi:hypothetical protein